MDKSVAALPKAELHVHIEGTVTPDMAKKLAKRHDTSLPADVLSDDGNSFIWNDFFDCVTRVYNAAAMNVRTAQDYEDVVYDYLRRSADEGCIYTELIAYPSHLRHLKNEHPDVTLTYPQMIDGIAAGIDRAKADTGIEARINVALVRHDTDDYNAQAVQEITGYPHPYVVGLDLAGGEQAGDIVHFKKLFDKVQAGFLRPLGVRVHAGEAAGPQNVHDAMDILNVSRIGHGIRAVEDIGAVKKLVGKGVVLEVCPTSNVLLVPETPDYASHPLNTLMNMGVKVTLASDDPGLFGNSIGSEYQVAKDKFGISEARLLDMTRTAIGASFVDDSTKTALLKKVDQYDFFLKASRNKPSGNIPRP